ncbi:hypothetical protein [Stenotrophomonas phage RAS14]
MRNLEKIKQLGSHPLEDILGIESNSTEIVKFERNTELQPYEHFDDKDTELENQYQEIADLAITAYKNLEQTMETAEPKFMARLTEVGQQSLNTALSALNARAKMKEAKDKALAKAAQASSKGNTTNQAVFILDRNQALQMVKQQMAEVEEVIEGEIVSETSQETTK